MFPAISFPGYYRPPLSPRLIAWYRADALLGINTALPADGTSVSRWFDISGYGNHAVQNVGANQPIFKTSIINGNPTVRFTFANSTELIAPNQTWLNPSASVAVYAVFFTTTTSPLGSGSTAGLVYKDVTTGNSPYGLQHSSIVTGQFTNASATAVTPSGGSISINTNYVAEGYYDGSTTAFCKKNNTSAGSSSLSPPLITANQSSLNIGRQKNITNRFFDGDMAEILIYGASLTSSERLAVRTYLGNKYNITIT